jgi:hypothetical protein
MSCLQERLEKPKTSRGEDREWLQGVVRYVEDMTGRSSPSVRQGLKDLAEGKLQA